MKNEGSQVTRLLQQHTLGQERCQCWAAAPWVEVEAAAAVVTWVLVLAQEEAVLKVAARLVRRSSWVTVTTWEP